MASVYKEGKGFTVTWFDSRRKRHFRRGLPTEAMANSIAKKVEFQKLAAKHGLIETGAEQFSQQAERPIEDHLKDFRKALTAKKNTDKYVVETVDMVERVFSAAGIERIDQIELNKVLNAVAGLKPLRVVKDGKLSHRTMNRALAACKEFSRWLVPERRPFNPLAGIKGWDVEQDRRRVRVALSDDQVAALLETTLTQKTRGGMTGYERMIRYALGLQTGFRQGTLFSLTLESFQLDGVHPFVVADAVNVKSRKKIEQPLTREMVELLRPFLATRKPKHPIFPKLKWADPMTAYRQDLKAAGIKYHDPDTVLYCDQHAQRNAFITATIRAAGLKVAQDMAGHSTPLLTSKYARLEMSDYAKALDGLPKLRRNQMAKKKKIG